MAHNIIDLDPHKISSDLYQCLTFKIDMRLLFHSFSLLFKIVHIIRKVNLIPSQESAITIGKLFNIRYYLLRL